MQAKLTGTHNVCAMKELIHTHFKYNLESLCGNDGCNGLPKSIKGTLYSIYVVCLNP